MSKKIVAMLMAVAMAFSLLPVTAFATGGTQEGNSQPVTASDKNLTMNKTVKPNQDGTYTVHLESYATGEVTNTTTTKPRDIVLLLDVSGSMDQAFTPDSSEYRAVYDGSLDTGKQYYIQRYGWYYEVSYCNICNKWTRGCYDWFGYHVEGREFIPRTAENDNNDAHTQFYEYVYTNGQSKLDALKTAVNKFIDDIAINSPQSNISIVKFAGKTTKSIGNETYGRGNNKENYTQIVKGLTKVGDGGDNQLKQEVSQLTAAGATSSDYGLQKAQKALENATKDKVVVLFTDGEPNHSNGFDYKVATTAVNTAKTLKQNNTTIYTVGVFKNPDNDINLYMSSVSSNYPEATATAANNGRKWIVNDGGRDTGKHYINAENAADLINAFQTISSEVSSTNLNGSAVVVDNVPSNFALNKGSVQVYTADCTGKNEKGELIWSKTLDSATSDITTTIPEKKNTDGSQTISTTGFNFSQHWCGVDGTTSHGKKLIIEFTIERTNYGGTQPTNAGAYIKAGKEANEEPIISLKNPEVPVTISLGSKENSLKNPEVKDEKPYDGTGLAILPKIAEKANALATGTDNAYVKMDLTVKVGDTTYTYKIRAGETAGKWYEGNREMNADAVSNIKTSPNVKRGEKNAVEPYTYNFNLKLSDKTEGGAAEVSYGPYPASFTIKPASVTVKANDQRVQKGTDPNSIPYTATVNGLVNGEQESLIFRDIKYNTYTVDTPATAVGSELEITATGAKEQGNYTVTYQPGKLTVVAAPVTTGTLKVTKEVQGENLTLGNLSDEFAITVTDDQGSAPTTLKLTDNNVEKDTSNTTATWTISGLTPGIYTVSESSADVKDYTYTAKYNGVAATQDNSATVTVKKGESSTMTVTNTYTKNATVKLSDLIKKELTVKSGSELPNDTKFTVTVTPTGDQPAITGTTTSEWTAGTQNKDGDTIYTASFNFGPDDTLSLPAGTYTYTVQETEGDVSGMQYDSNKYTLTITVPGNGEASYQAAPITIQNTYQAPDLSVEKKTVSVAGEPVNNNNPVAHVGEQIVWKVRVKNEKSTPARVTLTDAMAEGVYIDNECKTPAENVNWNPTAHSWTATVSGEETYYVNYTVKEADIPKGKIVNTIVMKNGDTEKKDTSDPVSTWDTKQLKSATSNLNTSDWTTTVTLELPKVNENKKVTPAPIAVKSGSYVIDQIGNEFTFMDGLSLTVGTETYTGVKDENTNIYKFSTKDGKTYPDTVTYDDTKTPAQFTWNINEDVYAGTEVTLSYKLKLTNPNKTAGTYGVTDLDGNGFVDGAETTKVVDGDALYTNEKAALYVKENDQGKEIAVFPKPSVSYTVSSGNSGSHSGGSRPSLNTKDHYGYIIGYPVDYYTGQPTTDQTKKPVRPEGKITRAEVATIYFRMLTDESRTKFWSQNSGYSDVKTGDWFNNAVSTLSKAGIIAGYEDGSFRPNGYITRAEFATIAARFFDVTYSGKDLFPDISGHWAKDYINQAANKGFVNGYEDGTFKPDRNITRAEAVTLVNRTLDRHPDKNHFTKDMLVWPDNMDQTKWYYADMQEATNSHTYQMKENSDKTKYENWTKTLPIRNWEALEKAWSNANSSQGNGNVV